MWNILFEYLESIFLWGIAVVERKFLGEVRVMRVDEYISWVVTQSNTGWTNHNDVTETSMHLSRIVWIEWKILNPKLTWSHHHSKLDSIIIALKISLAFGRSTDSFSQYLSVSICVWIVSFHPSGISICPHLLAAMRLKAPAVLFRNWNLIEMSHAFHLSFGGVGNLPSPMMAVAKYLAYNYGPSIFQCIIHERLCDSSIRIVEWMMDGVVEEGSEYQGSNFKNSTSGHES